MREREREIKDSSFNIVYFSLVSPSGWVLWSQDAFLHPPSESNFVILRITPVTPSLLSILHFLQSFTPFLITPLLHSLLTHSLLPFIVTLKIVITPSILHSFLINSTPSLPSFSMYYLLSSTPSLPSPSSMISLSSLSSSIPLSLPLPFPPFSVLQYPFLSSLPLPSSSSSSHTDLGWCCARLGGLNRVM